MIRRLKYFHDSHIVVIQAPGCDFPFFSFLLNVPNFLKHLLNEIEQRKLLSPFFEINLTLTSLDFICLMKKCLN